MSLLKHFTVKAQAQWAGRGFYLTRDERSGEAMGVVAESTRIPEGRYTHPNLPLLQPLVTEGEVRWMAGPLPGGDTLEDLMLQAALTEDEMLSLLLSVVDGVAALCALTPPVVPAYLDPACIRRDWQGCWILDYLTLAHAPEARKTVTPPHGVYAVGALLYWMSTGQTSRLSRLQVSSLQNRFPAGLQFIIIRCMGSAYASLTQLRADLEQAAKDGELHVLVHRAAERKRVRELNLLHKLPPTAVPVPGPLARPASSGSQAGAGSSRNLSVPAQAPRQRLALPPPGYLASIPSGGPEIPITDRPWALPSRPTGGFRTVVGPKPPNLVLQRICWWGRLIGGGAVVAAVALAIVVRLGLMPPELLPSDMLPSLLRPVPVSSEPAQEMPQSPEMPHNQVTPPTYWDLLPDPAAPLPTGMEGPPWVPDPERSGGASAEKASPNLPRQGSVDGPAPQPEPGSVGERDARAGGVAVHVYLDGKPLGYAYMFPHPRTPFISVEAFNQLFGRSLHWLALEGGGMRLFAEEGQVFTGDYALVEGRLWLRLTPLLQKMLGLSVSGYNNGTLFLNRWS